MPSQTERKIEEILKDDATLKRFLEINLELLSNLAKIGHGTIERLSLKDGKLLVKRQTLHIDGAE